MFRPVALERGGSTWLHFNPKKCVWGNKVLFVTPSPLQPKKLKMGFTRFFVQLRFQKRELFFAIFCLFSTQIFVSLPPPQWPSTIPYSVKALATLLKIRWYASLRVQWEDSVRFVPFFLNFISFPTFILPLLSSLPTFILLFTTFGLTDVSISRSGCQRRPKQNVEDGGVDESTVIVLTFILFSFIHPSSSVFFPTFILLFRILALNDAFVFRSGCEGRLKQNFEDGGGAGIEATLSFLPVSFFHLHYSSSIFFPYFHFRFTTLGLTDVSVPRSGCQETPKAKFLSWRGGESNGMPRIFRLEWTTFRPAQAGWMFGYSANSVVSAVQGLLNRNRTF